MAATDQEHNKTGVKEENQDPDFVNQGHYKSEMKEEAQDPDFIDHKIYKSEIKEENQDPDPRSSDHPTVVQQFNISGSVQEMAASSGTPQVKENSVLSLQQNPFRRRSLDEQMRIKELGPDRPDLKIQQQANYGGRAHTRRFSRSCYDKACWLTGCSVSKAFYCFPCLLFQSPGTEVLWTTMGVQDLKHLFDKCGRHELSLGHLDNALQLHFLGNPSIAEQLADGYRIGIRRHNEEVTRNRHLLSRIIDSVKYFSAFELISHCRHEGESSDKPGTVPGLGDNFVASLDGVLKKHLENTIEFKESFKTMQNELLNCMLSVLREEIIKEAQSSDFLSIQADHVTDVSTQHQLVLVLRYIDDKNNVQERFFEFIPLQSPTPDSIAAALKERLAAILPDNQKSKLISQTYNGAIVMRNPTAGVQKKIQDLYPNAHYVHCYAHQLNVTMQQVTSNITAVRNFFSDLGGFAAFFSRSPERIGVLDKVVAERLATSSNVRWNFDSCAISTVSEHREDLIRCFETIRASGDFDPNTVREAGALALLLEDQDFKFFLQLFYHIMPHVDLLYNKLQKNSTMIQESIKQFQQDIEKIRNSLHSVVEQSCEGSCQLMKRRRLLGPEDYKTSSAQVCDTIVGHTKEYFSFTDHLVSATLLKGDTFQQYKRKFPNDAVNITLKAYPVLNASKLRTELSLIYRRNEFQTCRGAVDLFKLFMENNLDDAFSETVTLLKILITTPMMSAEPDRCFLTLNRIKSFLRNTVIHEQLNALAMLSLENRLVTEMTDFNQRVIEKFSNHKDRRAKFIFK